MLFPPAIIAAARSRAFATFRQARTTAAARLRHFPQSKLLGSHKGFPANYGSNLFACFTLGAVGVHLASLGRSTARMLHCSRAAADERVAVQDDETLRYLCANLMRKVGLSDNVVREEAQGESSLDVTRFCTLMTRLGIECKQAEKEELFKRLDNDATGGLAVADLKQTLRNSSLITELYDEGVRNSLLALIPALILAVAFTITKGTTAGLDFVAGYLIEDSLSVDNLFVFLIVFRYFKVPPELQKVCLDLGIYGAVILRALFIFLGLAVVNSFKPVLLIFSAILLYSAFSALFGGEEEEDGEDADVPPGFIQGIVSQLPMTDGFIGEKLWITEEGTGKFLLTPLALSILTIELSDILFAVDSVPAVFAVTEDPLIVFTSNISAILGLRSLYQVLSIAVQDLVYLEKAVSVILAFVGFKLALEVADIEIASEASLAFILLTLAVGVGASLAAEDVEKEPKTNKKSTLQKFVTAMSRMLAKLFNL